MKRVRTDGVLRILHLEDDPNDALLVQRVITRNGIAADITVASARAEYQSAIEGPEFDLILADNGVPGYDGLAALRTARARSPAIPFICVSGNLNDGEVLVRLNSGATNFVSKDELEKLPGAIREAAGL